MEVGDKVVIDDHYDDKYDDREGRITHELIGKDFDYAVTFDCDTKDFFDEEELTVINKNEDDELEEYVEVELELPESLLKTTEELADFYDLSFDVLITYALTDFLMEKKREDKS